MMLRLEEAGIKKIIFHVHDEFIIEVEEKKAEQTLEQVLDIMSTAPDWIADIPSKRKAKNSKPIPKMIFRYKKNFVDTTATKCDDIEALIKVKKRPLNSLILL